MPKIINTYSEAQIRALVAEDRDRWIASSSGVGLSLDILETPDATVAHWLRLFRFVRKLAKTTGHTYELTDVPAKTRRRRVQVAKAFARAGIPCVMTYAKNN